MPENTINFIADDTNTVVNKDESNLVEENVDDAIIEINNDTQETLTKQTTQTTTQTTQASTQTTSSPSNNNSSSQKKETVTQSTTTQKNTTQTSTPSTSQSSSIKSSPQEETKTESTVERCTNNNNHSMSTGNSGKWFNSKSDAIAYYNEQIKYWGEQWENNKIDNDTYYKNCPFGYEIWDCMYCGKWTINFYYR